MLIIKPTTSTCLLSRIGFHLGASFIYAPLLVKTQRVYRIFKAGGKGKKKLLMTSNHSLMVVTVGLIMLEIGLIVLSLLMWEASTERVHRIEIEKRVELTCSNPPMALSIPLGFNIILLSVCVILGYLSRKLPENFNESWYIFVSVATTMFLWIVFLPTYFTMFYVYYKVVILGVCVLINGIITLLCLFIPKVYALYCVDDELIQPSSTISKISTNVVHPSESEIAN